MLYILSKTTMYIKKSEKYVFFNHNWEKNQTLETEITDNGLAYKEVKTAIINMFHVLKNIQEKKHIGGGGEGKIKL